LLAKIFSLKKNRWLFITGTLVWFVVTVILMTLPGSTLPKARWFEIVHMDKWVHIGMFGILVYLALQSLYTPGAHTRNSVAAWPLLAGIAYGTAMEFVQKYWVSNRSFDVWDIVADSVGCFLAYGLMRWQIKKAVQKTPVLK
jgi:VanZ family protein